VLNKNIPDLSVQLFLGTYNCEVNRVDVVSMIFESFQMVNPMDMTLRILGNMGANIDRDNVMFDLCMILQTMVIKAYNTLFDSVISSGRGKTDDESRAQKTELLCRPSLTRILAQHKKNKINAGGGYDEYIPPDMPLNEVCWTSKSSTEQQIILLIICVRPQYITSRHAFMTSLYGNVAREEIDMYSVKPQRMQSIIDVTMPILQKINNNIDCSRVQLKTIINSFTESCFKGIFGDKHKTILTFPFFVQMYIIAYLERSMQAKFYQTIITAFNRRLEHVNKELSIATYMPQNLIENMDFWCTNNMFSVSDIYPIFHNVCI